MKELEIAKESFHNLCTGCGACKNICPVGAITMVENDEGFLVPMVDNKKCIGCGKCERTCPVLNLNKVNKTNEKMYAVRADDEIRSVSSSGGIFSIVANYILENNGYVCGSAFDENMKLKHKIISKKEELAPLRGSKYLQSDTGNVYKEIEDLLKQDKLVLFVGTPCQVAGLKNVLAKDYKTLYTIDIFCHGVPSQKSFDMYLKDISNGKKVVNVDFRNKRFGWNCENILINFADGSEYTKSRHGGDPYLKAFHENINLRQSCENCKFAESPRHGDISIGDFWGIQNIDNSQNDGKGTSILLVNNKKGDFLKSLIDKNSILNEYNFDRRLPNRVCGKMIMSCFHNRYFKDFNVINDFSKLINMCLQSKYDVGIVGLWFGLNFGSVLTYYALYKVINQLGYSALMINKPNFMWIPRYENPSSMAQRFIRKHCNVSMVRDKNNLSELSNHCDAFIVGSDVVWNYEICGKTAGQFLFLDFVSEKCKKISYASSLGTGFNAPPLEHALSKHYINKFDAISVREQEAADICKAQFNVDADLVMDPVFLCDRNNYLELAQQSKITLPKNYIGSYILGPDERKKQMLEKLKEYYNLPFRIMPNPNHDDGISKLNWSNETEILHNGDVEDFLACINNCDYFFADSFHGLCFAIILHKQFVVVTGKYQKDNCRFRNLLNTVGEIDRLVFIEDFLENPNSIIEKMDKPINYEKVDKILFEKSKISLNWLQNALSKEKTPKFEISDYLLDCLQKQDNKISQLMEENKKLNERLDMYLSFNPNYNFISSKNVTEYLDNLANNSFNKIIFVAACDTLGLHLNTNIQKLLNKLGIKHNLINQHWKGFTCIIDNNQSVIEILAKNINEITTIQQLYCSLNVKINSCPYNAGNRAEIILNNINYAVNKRGLNIVVYDKLLNKVIDSVAIDTHSVNYDFYRK